jgi:hypothetical protein
LFKKKEGFTNTISGEIAEITKRTYNYISTFLQAAGIKDGNFQGAQGFHQKVGVLHYYDHELQTSQRKLLRLGN